MILGGWRHPLVGGYVHGLFCVVLLLSGGQVQGQANNDTDQGSAECQQQLMAEVYTCVSAHGIDFTAFLDIVSGGREAQNGSPAAAATASPSSTAAADTAAARSNLTKDEVCGPRREIMTCIVKSAKLLLQGSSCAADKADVKVNDQRFLIKQQLEAIIGQYDIFCAHPCRISLLDDMRACYTKYNLDPQIFLPTDESGPVLGRRSRDVEEFCENRESVFTCLQRSRDSCQESPLVLNSIGLDLELANKGFQVLCSDKEAYMKSLDCFDSHSKEVEYCQSIKYRTILSTVIKARKNRWSEGQYYQEVCGIILRHIQCDIDAWKVKKDEDCTEKTLNLKRKLHCTLIPEQCQTSHNATIAEVCTHQSQSTAAMTSPSWIFIIFLSTFLFQNLNA